MTYNPEEPRDYRGQWTANPAGTEHTAPGFPSVSLTDAANTNRAKAIAEKAEQVAQVLGFKPEKITITDAPHKFIVNGQEYTEGGHYNPQTEGITLRHSLDPDASDGVIAHEIMHAKFDALVQDYAADRAAMEKDPDYKKTVSWVPYDAANPAHVAMKAAGDVVTTDGRIREKGFMNPDGSLNEPYASRYPLYQEYNEVMKGSSTNELAKSDGVTRYSKDYWAAWQNKQVETTSAVHETLAEMARVKWDIARDTQAHKDNVKYIKKNGGTWTADDEKQWKQEMQSRTAYQNYDLRELEGLEGHKVYFATTKKVSRQRWEALYALVESNWKRRNKK